ncbi:SDR family oxidoreductase [Pseudomonas sp. KNUC1026]|nr:SDR family oxidoreductase [Pseudomonas sp. KNUC1026]UFH51659.1 SDR family oxidoreductase [Pseudomonas sp. KNUC1026]
MPPLPPKRPFRCGPRVWPARSQATGLRSIRSPGRINSEQILERVHPTEEARQAFIARHIPIGYFGDPEDIGYLVAFLASPLARYITGEVIAVDGGMHAFAH